MSDDEKSVDENMHEERRPAQPIINRNLVNVQNSEQSEDEGNHFGFVGGRHYLMPVTGSIFPWNLWEHRDRE
ncbi:unnamed protein product [Caenorhabditis angaria]|uniref:Uncharacterized protein n=1 Tax=Caenorhabditis angaria TaxID=860376 RepID=A0A9P1J2K6_9PELO|nr:unnamed protein product [Caenorhabditis angaria]